MMVFTIKITLNKTFREFRFVMAMFAIETFQNIENFQSIISMCNWQF